MKRSIVTTLALVAMSVIAAPGCGVVEGDEWVVPAVQEISLQGPEVYRLCREMEPELRGTEASGWTVRDYDRLVAVKFSGRVQCLDDVEAVRRTGIIPIDDPEPGCQFCGTPIVADVNPSEQIVPEGLVPFTVDRNGAQDAVRAWVGSRMFAPNRLKKVSATETLKGTYLPHWTFDASTQTHYSGLRGEHYFETEHYTVMVDGRPQTQTRTVMKTRWWPASGSVARAFDDVVVVATTQLAPEQIAALAPWALTNAAPYQPEFLSGYQTLRYDVQPDQGLEAAKQQMRTVILDDCRSDIGGDEQQVHSMDTRYGDLMFKLMLLPVWVAAYLYGGKSFQVFVNAYTGQVIGDRPYSIPKIVAAVVAGLIVVAVLVYLFSQQQGSGTTSGAPPGF